MQNFSQKYAIVQFFQEYPEGYEFSSHNWPLHSTIVDTFAIEWDVPRMTRALIKVLGNTHPASSIVLADDYFGQSKEVHVMLLQKTNELAELHKKILSTLEPGGLKLNDPHYANQGFTPHSTVQHDSRLTSGQSVTFDALSIIDMFPDNDPYKRKLLTTIIFKGA